jgi:hypothetical protein
MTPSRRDLTDEILWVVQWTLSSTFFVAGLLKATMPTEELQLRLRLTTEGQPGWLALVGVLEVLASLALVVPAASRVLAGLTPLAAAALAAVALAGAAEPAVAGGVGLAVPNLALAALAALVAWGRLAVGPLEPLGRSSVAPGFARVFATAGQPEAAGPLPGGAPGAVAGVTQGVV